MSITNISSPRIDGLESLSLKNLKNNESTEETSGNRFNEFMVDMMNGVNQSQVDANEDVDTFIKGGDISMHEIMLSAQEAQMSMQLLIECRNKVYDMYQQMNNVQI